ncbi:thioesterase II family protein [Nannocystis radixulma]|uniref:Alpha/beta fold hydrolase n=1 Tax=Nannocystis radixulma TaxID=2995305 RepID=A0ABT5B0X7_9BACT|nr:alpha/beta fold hydrolase [Nannocystis radixulma]MDC0667753.1 alpha/beta fold hydrolase [Nannocystis radixulma]
MDPSLWLPNADPRPTARLRLLCFAHAGGGSTPFVRWGAAMPEGVTVCPVRRPGRESAYSQPLLRDTRAIVDGTLRALQTLPPCPTALYGHSFGALVAYEVAAAMQAAGATPELLIVSAKPAPHIPPTLPNLAHLPNEQFIRELDRLYGGIPSEVKAVPELLELMLPAIRADLAASESYRHAPGPLLRCPIVACSGREDRAVEPERLRRWGELTACEFEAREFPGGHFFPYDPGSGFLGVVREQLARRIGA